MVEVRCLQCWATQKADTLTAKKKADRMEEWIRVCAKGIWLIFYMLVPHPERKTILVSQLCPTHCNPMDCSPPSSFVHGILQARILEWIAMLFSRGSSWPRDWTWVSCIAGRFFTTWATREALSLPKPIKKNLWIKIKDGESRMENKAHASLRKRAGNEFNFNQFYGVFVSFNFM